MEPDEIPSTDKIAQLMEAADVSRNRVAALECAVHIRGVGTDCRDVIDTADYFLAYITGDRAVQ